MISIYCMTMKNNKNLHYMEIIRYLWLRNIPVKLTYISEDPWSLYPHIECKVVRRMLPNEGAYNCNSNGASKVIQDLVQVIFWIRNKVGDFIFVEARIFGSVSSIDTEHIALRFGLEYCRLNNLLPLVLEKDCITF